MSPRSKTTRTRTGYVIIFGVLALALVAFADSYLNPSPLVHAHGTESVASNR